MVKQKWKSPKTLGNELESTVKKWLDDAGIPYDQESTMTHTGTRSKGSVDFKLKQPLGYIECKRYTDRLTYKMCSEKHDIKWSQVVFLYKNRNCGPCGFIVKEAKEEEIYFIPIESFMNHYAESDAKSITTKDIRQIGMLVRSLEFIKLYTVRSPQAQGDV